MARRIEPYQIRDALEKLALPSDFIAHAEHLWSRGASDEAYSSLMHIARILVGNDTLTFPYDQERHQYVNRYEGTSCPRPELSRAELDQYYAEWKGRADAVYPRLRRFADTDDSGFITAVEGHEVRTSFEYGLTMSICG
jgi:hypothetical protein